MSKLNTALVVTSLFIVAPISFSTAVFAAESKVTWTEPENYRDIRPAQNESRKNFEKRVFKQFEEHFAKLAAQLPENQVLEFNVTNVDLAGDTNLGISRMRVVKDIYFPRIDFSYQLINADKSIAKSGKESLKDMNFMSGSHLKYRNKSFGYEKKLLDDWFYKAFKDDIVHH